MQWKLAKLGLFWSISRSVSWSKPTWQLFQTRCIDRDPQPSGLYCTSGQKHNWYGESRSNGGTPKPRPLYSPGRRNYGASQLFGPQHGGIRTLCWRLFLKHSTASFANKITYPGYMYIRSIFALCTKDKTVTPELQLQLVNDAIEEGRQNRDPGWSLPYD